MDARTPHLRDVLGDVDPFGRHTTGIDRLTEIDEAGALAPDLAQAVTRLRRALQRSARAHLDGEALSPTEIELLLLVGEHPGIGVAAAAEELGAAPNTVSTLIRRLVENDLLCREFGGGDRRVARLSLTPLAEARAGSWRQRRADSLAESLGRLEPDQLRQLRDALGAMEALAQALYRPRRRSTVAETAGTASRTEPTDPSDGQGRADLVVDGVVAATRSAPPAPASPWQRGGVGAWPLADGADTAHRRQPVTVSDAERR